MTTRYKQKLIHEGDYVAELDVKLIDSNSGWEPLISLDDAYKLDDVRSALRRGDIKLASQLARVFSLTPVAA